MKNRYFAVFLTAAGVFAAGRLLVADRAAQTPPDLRDAPNAYGSLNSESGGKGSLYTAPATTKPKFVQLSKDRIAIENALFADIERKYHILLEPRGPEAGRYYVLDNWLGQGYDEAGQPKPALVSQPAQGGVSVRGRAVPAQLANQVMTERGLVKHTLEKVYSSSLKVSSCASIDVMTSYPAGTTLASGQYNNILVYQYGRIYFRTFAYKGKALPWGASAENTDFAKTKYGEMLVPMPNSETDWYAYGYPEITITAEKSGLPTCPVQYNEQECKQWEEMIYRDIKRVYNGGSNQLVMSTMGEYLKPRVMCGPDAYSRRVMPGNGGCGNQYGSKLKTTQCYARTLEQVKACDNPYRVVAIPIHVYEAVNNVPSDNFLMPQEGFVWFVRGDGKWCYTDYPPKAGDCMTEAQFRPF